MKTTYCNDQYLHYMFANSISPVAEGVKPSGLLTIWKYRIPDIRLESYLQNHRTYLNNGCSFEVLKETSLYYLVFFYHDELLQEILKKCSSSELLKNYPVGGNVSQMIHYLKRRVLEFHLQENDFPHEVGIFLGYPIWDVEGFIEHKGMNYKLCGYWKVYYDEDGAKEKFKEYDRIRASAIQRYWARLCINNHIK